jgi:L-lactate dehydrogenase complex protein LldF
MFTGPSDAEDARRIILELVQRHEAKEVIKIKTMTSEEIGLNAHLESHGIQPIETDLAELIIQMGKDRPSHFVAPALHVNRAQVRDLFQREMHLPELGDQPEDLTAAARTYLREKYLRIKVAISGGNFLIADSGGMCIVESEGNGRMCLTLPDVLISIVGIEKVVPSYRDLEVFLQTLPRSATGERMNPYNSTWCGVHPGDGPQGVSRSSARQRPQPDSRRQGSPADAAMHSLRGVSECLPGLSSDRRARV